MGNLDWVYWIIRVNGIPIIMTEATVKELADDQEIGSQLFCQLTSSSGTRLACDD